MKATKKTIKLRSKKRSITAPISSKEDVLYDKDFFQWTKEQAGFLRKGNLNELDIDNLREEIESLGRNDNRALQSQVTRLLMHLLKQKHQPEKRVDSNSWIDSEATMEI